MNNPTTPVHLIVMGVAGSGKTTVGKRLATRLDWEFADGDAFHTRDNIARMAAGKPLTDAQRGPWLDAITTWIAQRDHDGTSTVVACSALRRAYRDKLRTAAPDVRHVHLDVPQAELAKRLHRRHGHFMPAKLLASQLAALEPLQPDEPGITIGAGTPGREIDEIIAWLDGAPAEE